MASYTPGTCCASSQSAEIATAESSFTFGSWITTHASHRDVFAFLVQICKCFGFRNKVDASALATQSALLSPRNQQDNVKPGVIPATIVDRSPAGMLMSAVFLVPYY